MSRKRSGSSSSGSGKSRRKGKGKSKKSKRETQKDEKVAPAVSVNSVRVIDDDEIDQDDEVIDVGSASDSSNSGDELVMIDSESEDIEAEKPGEDVLGENKDFIPFDFDDDDDDEADEDGQGSEESDIGDGGDGGDGGATMSATNEDVESADRAVVVNEQYPWLRNNDHAKQLEVSDWLTMEIKDFVRYISPSEEEIRARNSVMARLNEAVTDLWPDAELHCFGSYATDMYLPGSDIDTVVLSKDHKYDTKSALYQLSSYLRTHKLGKRIETIAKAKVPIIKFVDPETNIHIDVSFERDNGITAAEIIIDWVKTTPGLRELVMVVKQFLAVRRLNEVHTGGLGGFSIICLVCSFLKLHPRIVTNSIDPMANLGVLLIEFFELYGFNFGYDRTAIAFRHGNARYLQKRSNPNMLSQHPFSLAIQDPQDPNNNISRGTFNLRDIKRSFAGAFEMLTNKCYSMNGAGYKQRLGQSILGDIIRYKGKTRDFVDARGKVDNYAYQIATGQASRDDLFTSSRSQTPEDTPAPVLNLNGASVSNSSAAGAATVAPDTEYISESSDNDESTLRVAFENSQSSNKRKRSHNERDVEELMAINDDHDNDTEESASKPPSKKAKTDSKNDDDKDFESSEDDDDDNYDPSAQHRASVDKTTKREYWLNKGRPF